MYVCMCVIKKLWNIYNDQDILNSFIRCHSIKTDIFTISKDRKSWFTFNSPLILFRICLTIEENLFILASSWIYGRYTFLHLSYWSFSSNKNDDNFSNRWWIRCLDRDTISNETPFIRRDRGSFWQCRQGQLFTG